MRSLVVLLLAIPMLAGCTTEGSADGGEDVQAAWADYQEAAGPDGDLTEMAMQAEIAFSFGDAGVDMDLTGDVGLHADGFQYRFTFDELVVREGGDETDLSGARMDMTCDPDGLRITTSGMEDAEDTDATVPIDGDCWDDEAVAEALGQSDAAFSPSMLTDALRGDFGNSIVYEGSHETDAGTVGEYRVALEGLTTDMQVLVDDGRVRQISLAMEQSMATVQLTMDMEYGTRGATPAHPA